MDQQVYRRQQPVNELDLALMTTDAVWGRPEVPPELKEILNKFYASKTNDGKEGFTIKSLWGLLGFYTRDMRLSNINREEKLFCSHFIDLAGDCLQENLVRPFIIALSRAATQLELAQSKGGFLRRRLTTLTAEHFTEEKEPPKRSLFGKKKDRSGYQ